MFQPMYKIAILGARYERANIARDFDKAIAVRNEITEIAEQNPEIPVEMWVIHGRNIVREKRGLGELGAFH